MIPQSHILRLREFDSADIGIEWDCARKTLSQEAVSELDRLQSETRVEFMHITRRRVKAQNYVGAIGIGERAIEILPKTDESDDRARRRLVEMLSIAGHLPSVDAGITDLLSSYPCLLDIFMQTYTRQLAIEWRRGRILDYRKNRENRACLRGKLLFQEQMRRNRLRPERFYTRADEFVMDVLPSRLLKAGLDVCRRHAISDLTRRDAAALLGEFDDVALQGFTKAELEQMTVDRRIARFEPLFTLAKRLVSGCVPDRPGGAATYSLLFDMNAVFERYLGRLIRQACPSPYRVHLQISSRSLAQFNGKPKFRLRPDIAIRRGKKCSVLIDTKWKLLDRAKLHDGVRQSDMYQAYAYAREYDCPRLILLHPNSGDQPRRLATYDLAPVNGHVACIDICTIDITRPSRDVVSQLQHLLSISCPT